MGIRMGDYHGLEPEQAPLSPTRSKTRAGRSRKLARPDDRTAWTCWRRCDRYFAPLPTPDVGRARTKFARAEQHLCVKVYDHGRAGHRFSQVSHTNMSRGNSALTRMLGTSTVWLIRRSTATLHSAYAWRRS